MRADLLCRSATPRQRPEPLPKLAGFQLYISGRFGVSTEVLAALGLFSSRTHWLGWESSVLEAMSRGIYSVFGAGFFCCRLKLSRPME
jgi:hypothetical protein